MLRRRGRLCLGEFFTSLAGDSIDSEVRSVGGNRVKRVVMYDVRFGEIRRHKDNIFRLV